MRAALLVLVLLPQDSFKFEGRSLYVWKEAGAIEKGKGEAAGLLAFCAERKVGRLYFMVSGKDTVPLREFVKAAHAAKVQVHAMHPGDMADWLDPFPARLDHKVILDWVRDVRKLGIFDGFHLDIEPHGTEAWKTHRAKLAAGYVELLHLAREAAGKDAVLSVAIPDNWDRPGLEIEVQGAKKLLVEHVQDAVTYVSVMAYRGKDAAKVLEAVAHECRYRPGRVELIQETDPAAVEEGTPLHVGSQANLEAVFQAAREKFGAAIGESVHHYSTWRGLK